MKDRKGERGRGRPGEGGTGKGRPGERGPGRPKERGAARPNAWRARSPTAPTTPIAPTAPKTAPPPSTPPPGVRLAGVEEIELFVEKLIAGGEGFARYDGVPIFVPRSVPGDRLRARLVERRPDYGRAEIVEVLSPGPGRRPDPVPELAHWGGCDLQHIADGLQSRLKADAVKETLERMGRVDLSVLPAGVELITGDPWHYRLRTQLHTGVVDGLPRVGYHARGTNELIPVYRCPLLVPELESLLPTLALRLGDPPPRRLDLAAGDDGISAAPLVPDLPHGEVSVTVDGLSYAYDARCFFQGHRGLLPRLVERAVGPWTGGLAYDLYCGVGLFALALARRYTQVVGVEGERIAARYVRTNARRNQLTNVEIEAQALESWIEKLPAAPARIARVIVDPPRAGLSPAIRRILVDRRPERLTYVSCHPAALARDLRQLAETYIVESVTLIDMFPQTGHMETVVQLVSR
jgi:23S rRNA (uracil1939-C5)-methyltransferase